MVNSIEPHKLFDERSIYVKFTSCEIELGIGPSSLLLLKSITTNDFVMNSLICPMKQL